MRHRSRSGIRTAQTGVLVNAGLAATKLVAGVLGNTYALVADAVESTADIFASLVVWGGLRVASRDPNREYPYGFGKAEPIAAVVVAFMMLGAAIGIGLQAVREIRTPHHTPAPWTLAVLVSVVVVKWALARRVHAVGTDIGSPAVRADAAHHLSDAITSAAAFVGISIALAGPRWFGGSGWEQADDWAALLASGVIAWNGVVMLQPALADLMDRMPEGDFVDRIGEAASMVPGVRAIEKLHVRRAGTGYYVDLHVQADPAMSLHDAHVLSGKVKSAIRRAEPAVLGALIHMEPHEPHLRREITGTHEATAPST
jgi:cation diffusion facilitator family transporter